MSSFPARFRGFLSLAVVCLALAPARAEVAAPMPGPARPWDAPLATRVETLLQQRIPTEAIQVRTANSGLVLSGQLADPGNLTRALALAEMHAPGRVSNLMTVGHLPQIELHLRLAEMPRAVARNLSASMGMAAMFAPSAPGETGSLPGLIDALEVKGVLRPIASATLTVAAGRVTHLPTAGGCTTPMGSAIGMDVTPTLAEDRRIAVTLRTCLSGDDPGTHANAVTIRLQDGQTFAVADVLPDLLRDPTAYSSALAAEPALGPLLSSADYREGRSEVMILITARIVGPAPMLPVASPHVPTDFGVIRVTEPAMQAMGPETFSLSHPLLK